MAAAVSREVRSCEDMTLVEGDQESCGRFPDGQGARGPRFHTREFVARRPSSGYVGIP